ncbi:hypothetical protein AX774_g6189 [Zancudomyces culisetae]|uniref:Uncharacterized protein n=1 Tax=Zancudomyces culisetae TaxID=1213189 RepID=A0A1R1PHF8_ZANCU|nr:hypothetical protein AX774_g6189 [Zancudomyces culisetae]|eukprot:OMH80377.1 hypothetical protein AX774_g6189 [Zancudomyces culisetae]
MMDILFLKANDTGGIYEDMLYYGGDEEDIPFVESSTGTDFNGSLATSATETADAIVEPTDKLISGGSTENINAGGVVKTSSFINKVSSIRSRVNKILTDKSLSTVRTEPSNVIPSEGKKSVITGHLVQDKQQEQIIKSMLKERDNRKRTNSNVSAISLEDDQAASKLHQKSSESMFSDSDKKSKDEPKNQAREDAYYLAGSSGTESRRSVLKDTTTKDNARTESIIKNKTIVSPNKIQQDASIIQDVVDQYASVKPIQSGPESSASKAVDTKVLTKPRKAAITLANANAGVDVDVNTNTPTNPIINQTIKQTVNQTLNQDTNPTVNTKSNSSSSSSSTSSTPFPSSISTTTTLVGNAAERAVTDTKNHLTDSSRPNTVDRISQKLEMARKGKMSDADGFSARLRAKNQLLASLKSTTATKIPSDDDDNISINTTASTSTSSSTDSKRSVFGKTKHGISGLFSAGKSKLRSKNSNITNPTINEGTKNDSMYLKTKKIDHATHVEDQVGHKDHFLGDSEFKLPDPKISNPPNTQQLKDKSMNHDGTPAIVNMDINTTKPTTSQSQQGTLRPSHIHDSSDTPEASLEHPPSSLATTPPKVTAAFPPINTDSSNTGTDTNAPTSDITKNNVGEPATPKLPVNQVGYTPVSISFQKQPDQPPTTDVSQPSLPFPDTHLRRTFDLSSLPALDAALPKYPSRSVHAARNNSVDRTGKAAYTYPTDTPALAAKSGSQLSNSTSPRSPLLIASHNSPNTDHPFFGGSNSLYSYPSASSKKSSLRSSLDYTASPSLTSNVFSSSTYSDRSPLNSVKVDDITNFERLMSQPHQNPGSRNRSVVLDFDVHSTPQNTISGGGGGTNDGLKINNNSDAINKTLDSNGKEKKVLGSYSVLLQPLPRLE